MPVTRSYACSDCGHEFAFFHLRRDELAPDCPNCSGQAANIPGTFSIKTNRSRAVDLAQSISEREYGMTDLRDNLRAGDVSAPDARPMQTAERESLQRQINEMAASVNVPSEPLNQQVSPAWQAAAGAGVPMPLVAQTAAESRSSGLDAVSLVQRAPTGGGPAGMRLNVLGVDRVKP